MNRSKKMKIFAVLMIMLSILIFNPILSNASSDTDLSLGSVFNSGKDFLNKGKENSTINAEEVGQNFASKMAPIINALILIGLAVSVGVAIMLGAAMVMNSHDPSKVAEYKKKFAAFMVAVLVFGLAYPIFRTVVLLLNKTLQIV